MRDWQTRIKMNNTLIKEAEAYAAYYSALEQAGAAWAAAEQAAYDEWQAAMCAAESTYTQTESQAWGRYIERLDELNSQLEHTRLILEAAFQTAWNNAVRDWTEMETAAWDAYQRPPARRCCNNRRKVRVIRNPSRFLVRR
jgi:hypothetical protein